MLTYQTTASASPIHPQDTIAVALHLQKVWCLGVSALS
jgi:hypothetical protein